MSLLFRALIPVMAVVLPVVIIEATAEGDA